MKNLTMTKPVCLLSACLALGLASLISISAADVKVDVSKLPPPSENKGVTYAKDIKPIIEKSCLKCHSGDRPKSRYDMTTREGVIKGGREVKAVKPGKSVESPAVHYVADLVPDLLRAWIDQGAK
jgi:hypothetical protein